MALTLKYTASKIDELEREKKKPIVACLDDTTISNLASFIEKGKVNEDGRIGCSRAVAFAEIDDYMAAGGDTDGLLLDIIEALVDAGFLSRNLNVQLIKQTAKQKIDQAIKTL